MPFSVATKRTVLVVACALFCLSGTVDNESLFVHEVKKGETISIVCIDYYGHYSGMIGEAILKLNPGIKNINKILPGQKLKLRKPGFRKKGEEKAATLFEKKVYAVQGVVTYVEGKAVIIPKNSTAAAKLAANTVVYPGDVIRTDSDGRVEIIINREAVVRLDNNTKLTIEKFRESAEAKGATSLQFSAGTLWTKVRKFADRVSRFQLELPTAIAGVHGTTYQTSVEDDSSSEVKVYDGEVAVKNRPSMESEEAAGPHEVEGPHEVSMDEWVQIVRSMQRITVDKNGQPGEPEPFTKDTASTWEKWNEERDLRVSEMFVEKADDK